MRTNKKYVIRTPEEIIGILNEWKVAKKGGSTLGDFLSSKGVNRASYYGWCKKYGTDPVQPSREIVSVAQNGSAAEIKQLRSENLRLRTIVSDLMLDKQALLEYAGRR